MANTITSYLSSAAPTSQLEVPTLLQSPSDFPSTATTASVEPAFNSNSYAGVDWQRLVNYEIPQQLPKRLTSWIYAWGWRVKDKSDKNTYWLCRLCHHSRLRPTTPAGHVLRATSTTGAAMHLRSRHRIDENGPIPVEHTNQTTLDVFQRSRLPFDYAAWKATILEAFTTMQVPFTMLNNDAFRRSYLLCEPRLEGSIPSPRTMRRWIDLAYQQSHEKVVADLAAAPGKINLSFDLWTSPGRRLSLFGLVAHYLNAQHEPRVVLLALPCLQGRHTACNIAATLQGLIAHFELFGRVGYVVTDNASENSSCMDLIATELFMKPSECHVLCMGHVINLVAQQILFGSDVDAYEHELEISVEEHELQRWRKKGPLGKLHNLIRFIIHSSTRRDRFLELQRIHPQPLMNGGNRQKEVHHLLRDNHTRWNSWYDAAERALSLKQAIDDFVDGELDQYDMQMALFNGRGGRSTQSSQPRREPKRPSLADDRLTADDWYVITRYVELLRPCKVATMRLQGYVKVSQQGRKHLPGAIWQVLPIYEDLMSVFEHERTRHPPVASQRSPLTASEISPPSSPLTPSPPRSRRTTRSSQMHTQAPSAACGNTPETSDDHVVAEEQTNNLTAGDKDYSDFEAHFSTNINLSWQKLDKYYRMSDNTPIYRAAVVLHPRMKWKWFIDHWGKDHPDWINEAHTAVEGLWESYKPTTPTTPLTTTPVDAAAIPGAIDDDSDDDADSIDLRDQYEEYKAEPRPSKHQMSRNDSPIPYWISKLTVWPDLARMALDVFATPACSDEPERLFSVAGNTMTPRRRTMTADTVKELICLRSWQNSGIVKLDSSLFDAAVAAASADDDDLTETTEQSHNDEQVDVAI